MSITERKDFLSSLLWFLKHLTLVALPYMADSRNVGVADTTIPKILRIFSSFTVSQEFILTFSWQQTYLNWKTVDMRIMRMRMRIVCFWILWADLICVCLFEVIYWKWLVLKYLVSKLFLNATLDIQQIVSLYSVNVCLHIRMCFLFQQCSFLGKIHSERNMHHNRNYHAN